MKQHRLDSMTQKGYQFCLKLMGILLQTSRVFTYLWQTNKSRTARNERLSDSVVYLNYKLKMLRGCCPKTGQAGDCDSWLD